MLNLTRTSSILIEGDSINDLSLPYQCMNAVLAYIDSQYMAPGGNSFRRPVHVSKATSGATTTTVATRIAGDLAGNVYTHALIQAGINDSQTGVPQATSVANVTAILTACVAAGVKGIWIGPFCNGEKSPTGQNAFDTTNPGIDLLDTALATLVPSFAGWQYISVRQLVYTVREPVLNAAQANSGVLTALVAASGPGIHPNPSGSAFIAPLVISQLAFG
jgi:hypothetical protein